MTSSELSATFKGGIFLTRYKIETILEGNDAKIWERSIRIHSKARSLALNANTALHGQNNVRCLEFTRGPCKMCMISETRSLPF